MYDVRTFDKKPRDVRTGKIIKQGNSYMVTIPMEIVKSWLKELNSRRVIVKPRDERSVIVEVVK